MGSLRRGVLAGVASSALTLSTLYAPAPAPAESLRDRANRVLGDLQEDLDKAAETIDKTAESVKKKAERAAATARTVYRLATMPAPTPTAPPADGEVTPRPPVASTPPMFYPVGELSVTFVDGSRPTEKTAKSKPLAARTLQTMILYPDGAPPGVRFPLIVFGHGMGARPGQYKDLLSPLAAAGYVVAAPRFPVSTLSARTFVEVFERLQNEGEQPKDLSFLIDQLLAYSAQPGVLQGRVDPDRIGAVGHSLGAITVIDLGYNECCFDRRVKAVISLSGTTNVTRKGKFFERTPPVPLLLVHGDKDNVVPYAAGAFAYAAAPSPKHLLTVVGGDHHFGLKGQPGSQLIIGALTVQSMGAFLDRYVKEQPDGIARLQAVVHSQPTILRLEIA